MSRLLMPKDFFRSLSKTWRRSALKLCPCFSIGGVILIYCVALPTPGFCQDDLFGNADFGGRDLGSPTAEDSSKAESESSPLTRQLMMQASRDNIRLAQSVSALSRTGRWAEVDQLLRGVAINSIPANVKADMATRIGPTQYLRINGQETVSAEAKAVLAALAKAQVQQTESPKRIAAAIKRLGSKDIDDRTAAARILFAGGNASIGAIADQLTLEKPITPPDALLPIYARFGKGIYQPLDQYALYGAPVRREKAIIALGRLASDAGNLAAMTAVHALDASGEERAIAASLLQSNLDEVPTPDRVTATLKLDLAKKRDAALLMDRDGQRQTLWTLSSSSKDKTQTLRSIKATHLVAAYRDAADAAARLKRLGRFSTETRQSMIAADLAYRVMVDPHWGNIEQVDSLRDSFGFDVSEGLLLDSIQHSVKLRDDAAVLGLLRWIAADQRLDGTTMLQRSGGRETPLVALATSSAVTRVRFEAALAVSKIASRIPGSSNISYPGISRVAKTLSEMVSLFDQPQAILVETRRDVIVSIEALLSDLGYRVSVVPSVSRLLSEIDSGGDVRVVLAKTQLWDMPAIELIDRVRRTPRGRDLPIVLYGDDEVRLGENRWKAATTLIPQPASTDALREVFTVTERRSRLLELSPLDRRDFRRRAGEFL